MSLDAYPCLAPGHALPTKVPGAWAHRFVPAWLLGLALVVPGISAAQTPPSVTTVVAPTADTSLDTRFWLFGLGDDAQLRAYVGSWWERDAYIRFAVPAVGVIQKATLRLYVENGSSGGCEVHLAQQSPAWTEQSFFQPADPAFLIGSFRGIAARTWVDVDVTSHIVAMGTLDVRLKATGPEGFTFGARESGATSPTLVVESLPSPQAFSAGEGAVVGADADTFVSMSEPRENFGKATYVFADQDSQLQQHLGFVRFPLAAARGNHAIRRATVRLYVTNGSTGRVSILPFAETAAARWSESDTTWENLPSWGVPVRMRPLTVQGIPANRWLELDATAAAQTADSLTLQVATTTSDGLGFNSREASTNTPQLVLEY